MANLTEFGNKLGDQLGSPEPGVQGKQWHVTNRHGVKSVISDEHYKKMQWESRINMQNKDQFDKLVFVEVTPEGELAAADTDAQSEPENKGGKKSKKAAADTDAQ